VGLPQRNALLRGKVRSVPRLDCERIDERVPVSPAAVGAKLFERVRIDLQPLDTGRIPQLAPTVS
jgi:hypothetical protein